jgi:hypothetical protein
VLSRVWRDGPVWARPSFGTSSLSSADEYVAVITCARSQPETRFGREAGGFHEGVPCAPPSNRDRPTTSPQAQPAAANTR